MSLPTKEQRIAAIVAKEEADRKAAHERAEKERIAKLQAESLERRRMAGCINRAIETGPSQIIKAVAACKTECYIRIDRSTSFHLKPDDIKIAEQVIKALRHPDYNFEPAIETHVVTWDERDCDGGYMGEGRRDDYYVAVKVTWEN